MELKLRAGNGDYQIIIEKNILKKTGSYACCLTKGKAHIVTDSNVFPLYFQAVRSSLEEAGLTVSHTVIPAGESSKSLEMLGKLYEECVKNKITRSDVIIALGGGVVGDLTGFLAATYLRGVPLMQLPTTLLAQIDSSVGGKTAIDLPSGKNLAGAFYQPKIVLIDPVATETLSPEIFSDGMAEAIKYALIRDRSMIELVKSPKDFLEEIIIRSVSIKRDVVEQDEFDTGERMILNFGHTVGHTIEKAGNYTQFTHGQAVAAGMVCAVQISQCLGLISEEDVDMITGLIQRNHLPVTVGYTAKECLDSVVTDKKMEGTTLNAVLLTGIGSCEIRKFMPEEFIRLASQSSIFQK